VYIDDEQMAWFEQQLAANQHRPVLVFSHAPPQGCGLKVRGGGLIGSALIIETLLLL